jgi:MFS family permease
LPFVIFGLRFAGQGMASHIAIVAMARWFVPARGRALSIAGLGVAAGEAFMPLIFVSLLQAYSWRSLWFLGSFLVLLAIPVLLMLLRRERTPQSAADESHSTGMENRHWVRREVLRHWLFWLLVPVLLGPSAFNTAFFFHQVHLADTKGWAHIQLVALFPLYTGIGIVFMMISGWAIDKIGTARLMPIYQLPLAVSFALMAHAQSLTAAAVAMGFMAVAVGANATISGAFWAEFYGTRHLGAIKAMAAAVMVFGSAIGPGLTGALIDQGIIFERQMIGISIYFVIACALAAIGIGRTKALFIVATPAI